MPNPSANDQLANKTGDVWFVDDGDCPICSVAARGSRIRKAVGSLNLVDA